MLGLVLDIAIAGLLVVVIVYAVILNRRLETVRRQKDELAELLQSFGDATARAERGVQDLKDTAAQAERDLDSAIRRARETQQALEQAAQREASGGARAAGGAAASGPAPTPAKRGGDSRRSVRAEPHPEEAAAPSGDEEESLRKLIGAARAEAFGDGETGGETGGERRGGGSQPAAPAGRGGTGDRVGGNDDDLSELRRPAARVRPRSRNSGQGDGDSEGEGRSAGGSRAEEALRRQLRGGR